MDCAYTPLVSVSSPQVTVGHPVTFTAQANLILPSPPAVWDLGNGAFLSGNPVSYTYPSPGSYEAVVSAKDAHCGVMRSSAPTAIQVTEGPVCHQCAEGVQGGAGIEAPPCEPDPEACCGDNQCNAGEHLVCPADCQVVGAFSVSVGGPYEVEPGEAIHFDPTVTLNAGELVQSYAWNFGDGSTSASATPLHAYSAEGEYIVSLTVTTDHGLILTALTPVLVGHPASSQSDWPDFLFYYDQFAKKLVVSASYEFTNVSLYSGSFIKIVVLDPNGHIRILENLAPSPFYVEIPTPANGLWSTHAEFFLQDRLTGYYYKHTYAPTFTATVIEPVCVPTPFSDCLSIVPHDVEVEDGAASQAFQAVLSGSPAGYNYSWSFAVPGSPGNSPGVQFTPSNAANTMANGRWFAFPDNQCFGSIDALRAQAVLNPTYSIQARATAIYSGVSYSAATRYIVTAPWPIAATTPVPHADVNIKLAGCDGVPCTIDEAATVAASPRTQMDTTFYFPLSSQFFGKILAHEQEHVEQFATGIGSTLFTITGNQYSLMRFKEHPGDPEFAALTAPTEAEMFGLVAGKLGAWTTREDARLNAMRLTLEQQAYAHSDQIAPFYVWQLCNLPLFILN